MKGFTFTQQTPGGISSPQLWQAVGMSRDGGTMIAGPRPGRLYLNSGGGWVETQPVGAVDKNWRCASTDGTNHLVGEFNGRLYRYSSSAWAEEQPGGNVSIRWNYCAIDGTHMVAASGLGTNKLYYYNGSTWSDVTPGGSWTWRGVSIIETGPTALVLATGTSSGTTYAVFFNGVTWSTYSIGTGTSDVSSTAASISNEIPSGSDYYLSVTNGTQYVYRALASNPSSWSSFTDARYSTRHWGGCCVFSDGTIVFSSTSSDGAGGASYYYDTDTGTFEQLTSNISQSKPCLGLSGGSNETERNKFIMGAYSVPAFSSDYLYSWVENPLSFGSSGLTYDYVSGNEDVTTVVAGDPNIFTPLVSDSVLVEENFPSEIITTYIEYIQVQEYTELHIIGWSPDYVRVRENINMFLPMIPIVTNQRVRLAEASGVRKQKPRLTGSPNKDNRPVSQISFIKGSSPGSSRFDRPMTTGGNF